MPQIRIIGSNVFHEGPLEEFALVEVETDRSVWQDDISFRRIIRGRIAKTGPGWGQFRGTVENLGGLVSFATLVEEDPCDNDSYLNLRMEVVNDEITLEGYGTVQSHQPKKRHWPEGESPFRT